MTPHSDDHPSRLEHARTPASLSLMFDFSDRAIAAQTVQFQIEVPSDSESVRSEESGSNRSA